MIPPILHRTVPTETTVEVEAFWAKAEKLHQGWVRHTWRDPLDPADWPLTADHWDRCTKPAQRAGLIRLEALIHFGGIYIDSDLELYRPLDPLRSVPFFATWEDNETIPDFVFGAEKDHPLLYELLGAAFAELVNGPWASGPGVFTRLLADEDVLLLPPQSFAEVHYTERDKLRGHKASRYAFGQHHWHGSWLA
jgi:mannosyltransferase OCH1-like enzyme